MAKLRGGLIGCGFFARNHLHAWRQIEGADIVALCDMNEERARVYANEFGAEQAYGDPEAMLERASLDFVDIVTQPATHRPLVELAAHYGVNIICQKPLAPSLEDARAMVAACKGVRFMVHENFRWQTPMRALKEATEGLGELFYGRVHFRSAYDVYANQPYLATDERFIIYDLGVHLLDVARFFMGDVKGLYCRTQRANPRIRGEDLATIMLEMASGATCVVEMSYFSKFEDELFPQTLAQLEGVEGSAGIGPHYVLTRVGAGGVEKKRVPPRVFSWSTPPAEVIQESVVAIQRHWVACLNNDLEPETSGEDNLKTLELVFGAYESAERGELYRIGGRDGY
jgi:D-apiose dehydrogenase